MPIVVVKILIALALDQCLGEPRRLHPLVGFGQLATKLEVWLNRIPGSRIGLASGLLAWTLAIVPLVATTAWLSHLAAATSFGLQLGFAFDVLVLYLAIGRKSLFQHSRRVYDALCENNLASARYHTSMIVSRDCKNLDAGGCARAATESVLENGSDSLYGALFWFVILGAPGVVMYRLANTLDAMWGYRNSRYTWFGAVAARLDDVLNLVPARLCAVCYALAGNTRTAFQSWYHFARRLTSPNAGPVMSAGAGALNIRLGGPATYHGIELDKPFFGGSLDCQPRHVLDANRLVDRSLIIFIALISVVELGRYWLS